MEPTNTFWQDINLSLSDSPSLSFMLFENKDIGSTAINYYIDNNKRLKSKGSIQTMLELHKFMSNSLSIISPYLLFTPDFPDYILSIDDPKQINVPGPTLATDENAEMPHHRNDLWQRNYANYQGVEMVPTPHITWGVVRQEPGTVGSVPFRGTQEVKPRTREFVAIYQPDIKKYTGGISSSAFVSKYGKLDKFVEVKAQCFDNLVQYNMWARSAWEVEELTEWFKNYMLRYTGMFREAGLVQIYFDRRVRDDTLIQIKNKYHLRSLLYYVRTEEIDIYTINPIRRIDVDMHVKNLPTDLATFNPDDYIVDVNNKLLEKWHGTV